MVVTYQEVRIEDLVVFLYRHLQEYFELLTIDLKTDRYIHKVNHAATFFPNIQQQHYAGNKWPYGEGSPASEDLRSGDLESGGLGSGNPIPFTDQENTSPKDGSSTDSKTIDFVIPSSKSNIRFQPANKSSVIDLTAATSISDSSPGFSADYIPRYQIPSMRHNHDLLKTRELPPIPEIAALETKQTTVVEPKPELKTEEFQGKEVLGVTERPKNGQIPVLGESKSKPLGMTSAPIATEMVTSEGDGRNVNRVSSTLLATKGINIPATALGPIPSYNFSNTFKPSDSSETANPTSSQQPQIILTIEQIKQKRDEICEKGLRRVYLPGRGWSSTKRFLEDYAAQLAAAC